MTLMGSLTSRSGPHYNPLHGSRVYPGEGGPRPPPGRGESVITTRRQVVAASVVPVAALASLLAGAPAAQAATVPAASVTTAAPAMSATATTAASAATSAGTLRPGSKGKAVLAAQKRLAALGYWLGTPDGVYGPATTHAVIALQKVAGLARDGVLGPKTAYAVRHNVKPKASTKRGQAL